ncbi:HAD family hydrolase [Microvirga sp. 2TAF3]|uniref:HAD family hydrolase n=1 Tax=Microvirga sp. 2TAF3 TaxID=3233014 RepID=UPI003F9B0970
MKPLSQLPLEQARSVRVVLTDIDDTITTEGTLTASAYGALEALQRAGFLVVPVTGRPAGWCDHIARMWPVDAVVGENGAFYFRYDREKKKMHQHFWASSQELKQNRTRLDAIEKEVLATVPGAALASDQAYRVADLAIDFCEDVPALPESEIDRIVAIFERAGAQAKVSSIHVNGWFGAYDKLSMAKTLLADVFGIDWAEAQKAVIYAGDSPNDEPMFAAFPLSVGVANIHAFAHRLKNKPAYITQSHSGGGFAELATLLLRAKCKTSLAPTTSSPARIMGI